MTEATTRKKTQLRPVGAYGVWIADAGRYYENAHTLLAELEVAAAEVKAYFPVDGAESLQAADHPELGRLARRRDLLSDSTRVFTAMAVEGFINFYGVVRMGEEEFSSYERLGLIPKLIQVLHICDSLLLRKGDPLLSTLQRVAERRNSLVHPKAKEAWRGEGDEAEIDKSRALGPLVPGYAREAVADMDLFFKQFVEAVPASAALIPTR